MDTESGPILSTNDDVGPCLLVDPESEPVLATNDDTGPCLIVDAELRHIPATIDDVGPCLAASTENGTRISKLDDEENDDDNDDDDNDDDDNDDDDDSEVVDRLDDDALDVLNSGRFPPYELAELARHAWSFTADGSLVLIQGRATPSTFARFSLVSSAMQIYPRTSSLPSNRPQRR